MTNLSGPNKELSIATLLEAHGSLVRTPINSELQVSSVLRGDEVSASISGTYPEAFQFDVSGEFGRRTIAGVSLDALVLNNLPENIVSLHEVVIYYKNMAPIGMSVSQSSFVGEWLVDIESPLVFLNLENTDSVIPLVSSTFRADANQMEGQLIYTPGVRANVNFVYLRYRF